MYNISLAFDWRTRNSTRCHPFLHFGFPFVFLHDICIVQSKQPMLAQCSSVDNLLKRHITHKHQHMQLWSFFTWHFSHIKWHRRTMNQKRSLCKQLKCHHCNHSYQHIQIPLPPFIFDFISRWNFQHNTKNEEEETTHQWTLYRTARETFKRKIKIQNILFVSRCFAASFRLQEIFIQFCNLYFVIKI